MSVYTFEQFGSNFIVPLISIVNHFSKKDMRKIIKNLVSIQSDETKQMLFDTYKCSKPKTERQVVNIISRSVELYRFDEMNKK